MLSSQINIISPPTRAFDAGLHIPFTLSWDNSHEAFQLSHNPILADHFCFILSPYCHEGLHDFSCNKAHQVMTC